MADPFVGILNKSFLPTMVWVSKVDRCAKQLLEVLPVRKGNVVVGQDGFNNVAVKHPLEGSG